MLSQTRRLPDRSRVQVQGFGRNQVQKAVWAEKKVAKGTESGIIEKTKEE